MKTLKMRKNDGTVVDIPYKPTNRKAQSYAVARWYIDKQGWRPSEAAMHMSKMSAAKLRRIYQALVMTEEIKQ